MKVTVDDYEIIEKHRLGKSYLAVRCKENNKIIMRFRERKMEDFELVKNWLENFVWYMNLLIDKLEPKMVVFDQQNVILKREVNFNKNYDIFE